MKSVFCVLMGLLASLGAWAQTTSDPAAAVPTIRICDSSGCSDRPRNSSTFRPDAGDPEAEQRLLALTEVARDDPRAAYDLGLRYFRGDGVEQNSFQAIEWMRSAGERGDLRAQQALGRFYMTGLEEMGSDPAEAERWLALAADRGDAESKKMLVEARKAKTSDQAAYHSRERWRKNGWLTGWHSGYAYRCYWRTGRWHFH